MDDAIATTREAFRASAIERARLAQTVLEQGDEIRRLRQIIREYARHTEGCSAAHGDQYRCRCGWRDVAPEFA